LNILIAPNAFKDALSAAEAADAIATGLLAGALACRCDRFPVADGGDGTGELLIERLGGERRRASVRDPLGRRIEATFGLVGRTAVVEMAAAAGLRLLRPDERDPLRATSFGAGQLIQAALGIGAQRIVLAVGGSATVDGGAGLLEALGADFLDASGAPIADLPRDLARLEVIDLAGVPPELAGGALVVLCDVESPILGPGGAAAVYGPQKGASPEAVKALEGALTRLCDVIRRQTGRDVAQLPRGGAAGGVAAGLAGLLGAELVRGIDYFLDETGFEAALGRADLVVTGEGRIDAQTLQGKAPMGVAMRARARNVPVVALAGQIGDAADLARAFDLVLPIADPPRPLAEALSHTEEDLTRVARSLGDQLAAGALPALSRRRSSG
jgi:glycerate kinase